MRILITKDQTAFMNMAIDEAVLDHVDRDLVPPTLRLYSWKPSAVSVGYFQSLADEVDLDRCQKLGVDCVRRITGGGAVYHGAEITYSVITKKSLVPKKILESYKYMCGGVIAGLKKLGVDSQFVPLNDIIAGGKKISGNAQTRKRGCVLQHGTILLDVDVAKMFSLLLIPDEKIRDKMISAVSERVTSVNKILGREIDFDSAAEALIGGFARALKVDAKKGALLDQERQMAQNLAKDKYSSDAWNFKR